MSNATLPSEQKIEELLQRVTELQVSYPNSGTEVKNSVPKGEDKNVYLFKVRLDIETSLCEMCEKIGYTERMTIVKIVEMISKYGDIVDIHMKEAELEDILKEIYRGVKIC